MLFFFFSSRRRHTRYWRDWSSDVCSSDLGTGGGIFLSPLLLFTGWAGMRPTSGASAAFILVNSVAGLSGNFSNVPTPPAPPPKWAVGAAVGALVGGGPRTRTFQRTGLAGGRRPW